MTRRPPRRSTPVSEIADLPDTALEGMPRSLAAEEESSLRRLSPLRNRWPEIAELDRRAAELDQRAAAVAEELRLLMEERTAAPERDARSLAQWFADGEEGDKPASSRPELDRRTADLERERDGLRAAADAVLEAKAGFVEKHRKRVVRDADAQTAKLRERASSSSLSWRRPGLSCSRPAQRASGHPPTRTARRVRHPRPPWQEGSDAFSSEQGSRASSTPSASGNCCVPMSSGFRLPSPQRRPKRWGCGPRPRLPGAARRRRSKLSARRSSSGARLTNAYGAESRMSSPF